MTNDEKELFLTRINEMISKHNAELEELMDKHKPVGPENAIGRISRMDAIHNKSIVDAAIRAKKAKVSRLKLALSKLDSPEFGQCTRCGGTIAMARLVYMPESSMCMKCAR